jgi:hypothetical protein
MSVPSLKLKLITFAVSSSSSSCEVTSGVMGVSVCDSICCFPSSSSSSSYCNTVNNMHVQMCTILDSIYIVLYIAWFNIS